MMVRYSTTFGNFDLSVLFGSTLGNHSKISIVFVITLAGDYVKFNFPQAQALTTLAWGAITYENGYKCAGEWDNMLDAIKWGTDYFLKCHVSDNVLYGQVVL
jgi:hypothetical protein